MNKHVENHKPKGITLEGFWRQVADKTAKKDGVSDSIDPRDLSKPNDDWVARFDEWLNGL